MAGAPPAAVEGELDGAGTRTRVPRHIGECLGDGRQQARGGVVGAEEVVDQGVGVEQERSVRERVVDVGRLAGGEFPREGGVDALVMVLGAVAEVPQPGEHGHRQQRQPEEPLEGEDRAPVLHRPEELRLAGRRHGVGVAGGHDGGEPGAGEDAFEKIMA